MGILLVYDVTDEKSFNSTSTCIIRIVRRRERPGEADPFVSSLPLALSVDLSGYSHDPSPSSLPHELSSLPLVIAFPCLSSHHLALLLLLIPPFLLFPPDPASIKPTSNPKPYITSLDNSPPRPSFPSFVHRLLSFSFPAPRPPPSFQTSEPGTPTSSSTLPKASTRSSSGTNVTGTTSVPSPSSRDASSPTSLVCASSRQVPRRMRVLRRLSLRWLGQSNPFMPVRALGAGGGEDGREWIGRRGERSVGPGDLARLTLVPSSLWLLLYDQGYQTPPDRHARTLLVLISKQRRPRRESGRRERRLGRRTGQRRLLLDGYFSLPPLAFSLAHIRPPSFACIPASSYELSLWFS
jgi:hypothetical protein